MKLYYAELIIGKEWEDVDPCLPIFWGTFESNSQFETSDAKKLY